MLKKTLPSDKPEFINLFSPMFKTTILKMLLIAAVFFIFTNEACATMDINNIVIRSIKTDSFVVEWDSTQGGTSQIIGAGITSPKELFSYFHITEVTNLTPGTVYNFRIQAIDRNGIIFESPVQTVTTKSKTELDALIRQFRTAQNANFPEPQVYYVKPNGNNSLDGKSISNAWQTLRYAVTKVYAGDTIYIMPGTWTNQLPAVLNRSGTDIAPITIRAYDPNNKPIFTSSSYQGNPVISTSDVVNFQQTVININISYWNIDGLTMKNHWRPTFFNAGTHHINVLNCDYDSNNTSIFIYENSHHIITKNIKITRGSWNDWFLQNGPGTVSGVGTHHILADNVTSINQGYYGQTDKYKRHSCFDLHSENDPTGTNSKYVTLWNCSALDAGVISYDITPIFIHAGIGSSKYISIINWTVKNMYRAILDMSPGEEFYADGISGDNTLGINIVGYGKNVVIKNANINMRQSIIYTYGSSAHGFYVWANKIEGLRIENVQIKGVQTKGVYACGGYDSNGNCSFGSVFFYPKVFMNGAGVTGLEIINSFEISDTIPPTVTSTDPANNGINIPAGKTIAVSFNETIQSSTGYNSIILKDSNNNTINAATSINASTLSINPAANLDYNKSYTVFIPAAAVKDSSNNNLANSYTFSFTTQDSPIFTSIDVSPITASIVKNATQTFIATPKDQFGNPMSGVTVTWTSSNNAVAIVNSSGIATGVTEGSATITATGAGKTATAALTVAAFSANPTMDTAIKSGEPATARSAKTWIDLGRLDATNGNYRGLLNFDLSTIPADSTINSAILTLAREGSDNRTQATTIGVYRPSGSWNNSATWNSRQTGTLWSTAGGDWVDASGFSNGLTPYAQVNCPLGSNDDVNFDVKALVQSYVNGTYPNTGFFLKTNEVINNYFAFHSIESTNSAKQPKLTISYTPGSVDTTAPVISGVSPSPISSTGAIISWSTNESSDSQVEYGVTTNYGSLTTLDTNMVSAHSQTLSGLTADTLYHYRVKSKDAVGNQAASADNTFTTTVSNDPVLTSIIVSPANPSITPGATQTFTATPKDQFGNTMSGVAIAWSSSNTAIATIASSTGVATGVAAGSSSITAASGSISGTASLAVAQSSGKTWYIAKTGSGYTADFYCDNGTTNNVVIQQAINAMSPRDTLHFYPGKYYCDYPITANGIHIEGPSITPSNLLGYNKVAVFDDPNAATLIIKSGLTNTANWRWGTCLLKVTDGSVKNMVFDGNVNNNTGGYFRMGDLYLNLLEVSNSTVENSRFQNGFCDGLRHSSNNTIRGNFFIMIHHDSIGGLYTGSSDNIIENNTIRRPYTTDDKVNGIGWWYNAGFRMYSGKNNIYRNNYIDSFGMNLQTGTLGFEIHGIQNKDSSNNIIENNIIKDVNESAIWFMEIGYRPKSSQASLRGQIVRNNLIVNASKGVTFSSDADYNSQTKTWAMLPGNWNEITIENNTFINVGLSGIYALGAIYELTTYNGVGSQPGNSAISGNVYVKNNIIYNSKAGIGSGSNGKPSWFKSSYNLFYNSGIAHGSGVTVGYGIVLDKNPLFVSAADFHLQPNSPALGAGENGVDMGAYGITKDQNTVSAPYFSPQQGTYSSVQDVSIATETTGATIYYTLDDSDPASSPTRQIYASAVNISTTKTIKAKAFKDGLLPSVTVSAAYNIDIPVLTSITVSPASASFAVGSTQTFIATPKDQFGNPMSGIAVTWTSSNNAIATVNSSGVTTGVTEGSATITASGGIINGSATAVITALPSTVNLVSNPSFESGTTPWTFYTNGIGTFGSTSPGYAGNNSAKLAFSSAGSNIQLFQTGISLAPNTRYRLSFAAYSTSSHDLDVKLIKHASPYTDYGLVFTANLGTSWQVFTTEFITKGFTNTVNDGRLFFWLAPFAAAGDIYYIDNVTLETVTATPKVATPTFSPASGTYITSQNVTISTTTLGATIHYTIDGATPTEASPIYSTPITIASTTTLKAGAWKSGMIASESASAAYTITPLVNLAPNPDFEADPALNYQSFGNGTFSWASDYYHAGTKSLKIVSSQPTGLFARWVSIRGKISATAGKTYTASVWMKTSNVSQYGELLINFWDANLWYLNTYYMSNHIARTSNWTNLTVSGTAPANAKYVRIEFRLYGPGTIWVDDVELK